MTKLSPLQIEILLHHHTSPTAFLPDSSAYLDERNDFIRNGCLVAVEMNGEIIFQTTPKGAAWVEALRRVQMPREAFIDEHGNILDEDK